MVEHPHLLVASVIAALPMVVPLTRLFFGSFDQLVEDVGRDGPLMPFGILFDLLTLHMPASTRNAPGIALNIIGFVVSYAAFAAAAYHLLLWALPHLGVLL